MKDKTMEYLQETAYTVTLVNKLTGLKIKHGYMRPDVNLKSAMSAFVDEDLLDIYAPDKVEAIVWSFGHTVETKFAHVTQQADEHGNPQWKVKERSTMADSQWRDIVLVDSISVAIHMAISSVQPDGKNAPRFGCEITMARSEGPDLVATIERKDPKTAKELAIYRMHTVADDLEKISNHHMMNARMEAMKRDNEHDTLKRITLDLKTGDHVTQARLLNAIARTQRRAIKAFDDNVDSVVN